ncbi:MAG TPA: inositol monophosphatase family protein, partial [Bdellovibrionota bacterium]|nr:inositol monophosphatase family protein [Bdellovibrionota bacterium]
GYWERGLCPWDTAAAQLIVTEAGGKVTNFSGAAYDYYKSDIVASNSALHKVILENF